MIIGGQSDINLQVQHLRGRGRENNYKVKGLLGYIIISRLARASKSELDSRKIIRTKNKINDQKE